MRLLLDEMFSPRLARGLRERGHDVAAVGERSDLAGRPDPEVLDAACAEMRTLVTEDVADYARLARDFGARGLKHGGILFTSTRRFPRGAGGSGALLAALEKLLADRPAENALEGVTLWLEPPSADPAAC
ncbi:MAG: DUF5615 family PIN-like protein [Gaiellaceae bacterium]